MNTNPVRIATLVSLCVGVWATEGAASRIRHPPLTEVEALEIAVSSSDAVVVATVVRDTHFVAQVGGWLSSLIVAEVISLKGDVGKGRIMVLCPQYGMSVYDVRRMLSRSQSRGIFFLRKTRIGWMLNSGWDAEVLPLGERENAEMVHRIRALAEGQTLENVAREAPLIVLGRGTPGLRQSSTARGPSYCLDVPVEEVIAGTVEDSVVVITSLRFPALPLRVRAVYFLRPGPEEAYELVGSHAGVIPLEDYDGKPLQVDVPGLVRRIHSLREAGRPRER